MANIATSVTRMTSQTFDNPLCSNVQMTLKRTVRAFLLYTITLAYAYSTYAEGNSKIYCLHTSNHCALKGHKQALEYNHYVIHNGIISKLFEAQNTQLGFYTFTYQNK